jgi:hypothetical protein
MEYPPVPDTVYRNNGDGSFTDMGADSGVSVHAGTGMGTVCGDYDNDGDTDIFVLNDVAGNFFFENDGQGNFTEVGVLNGLAYNLDGHELGSMGVDCGDYDNDGWLDFFMTSYQGEFPVLYKNLGERWLQDVTLTSGAGAGAFAHVNWGTGFVDFDNDGDRDLFLACGHLQDNVELYDKNTTYRAGNILLVNTGDGRFTELTEQSGGGLAVQRSSRGAGFGDLDNDGDIDVVILNSRQDPTLLRNETSSLNHWLMLQLRGSKTNRDGIGAHVRVTAGGLTQLAEVHSGRGYQSHFGMRLHFGLGTAAHIDRIEVRWIGGGVDVAEDVDVDQLVDFVEGYGVSGLSREED